MKTVLLFLVALVIIPVIDYLWLAQLMGPFYIQELGSLARQQNGVFAPLLLPALVVYVCLALGVVFLVLPRAQTSWQALSWGALLGFVVYGVYDMTNLSLVQGWPLHMSLLDIGWGTFLCAFSSFLLLQLRQRLAGGNK